MKLLCAQIVKGLWGNNNHGLTWPIRPLAKPATNHRSNLVTCWNFHITMNKNSTFFVVGFLALFLIVSGSFVQLQAEETNLKEYQIEEIVVTAEKKSADIQEVPMSISAFSDINLNDSGINEIPEIARFSPNVYMKRNSIVIRGVTQYYGSKNSTVGIYQDDISLPFDGIGNFELFDIERIEILKGPQGTLYGKNSEAGVVNIITKQPGNEVSGKIYSEYSWYDTEFGNAPNYIVGTSLSSPIVKDKLYFRLTGKWNNDAGYMKNEYNGDEDVGKSDNFNGRINLRWTPRDRWDFTFIADAMQSDYGYGYFRYITGPLNEGRHRISYNGPCTGDRDGNGQTLRVKYSGDEFNVLSITGRRHYRDEMDYDFDMTSLFSMTSKTVDESTSLSQEIRISSVESNNPFQWLAGVYFFDEDIDIYQDKISQTTTARNTDVDSFGYAFFGQGTYTFIDKLHLTAGLRYDFTDFKGEQKFTNGGTLTVYDNEFDNKELLPKASVSFDFSDDLMAYTSVARGYLTGGYNCKWATNANNLTYEPEYTWNYEIGIKSAWFDNRVIANISAFYIEMKDKQVAEWDTTSGPVSVKAIRNASNAYSRGLELTLQARPPVRGVDLFAGFGVIEAEIDDWISTEYDSTTGRSYQYDYSGNRLPNVPSYTYNLGVQYRHMSGFFCRADWLGTGSVYSDSKNTAKEDRYQIFNLRLGFESENYDIYLWCKNLFDEEYLQVRFAGSGAHQGLDGDPRMMGISFTYRF